LDTIGQIRHIAKTNKNLHTMRARHRIFVSVENNAYCGWQSKLFYFSSVTRLNHQPTFIVHDSGGGWHSDFYDLAAAGATVVAAPSYIQSVRDSYRPRNTAGSLVHAVEMCDQDDLIVLCDPDMIFLGNPKLPSSLSVNFYRYMDYDRAEVRAAMRKLKIPISKVEHQKEELRGGVPYVIPAVVARQLGTAWLEAVDAFVPRHWIDIMHAFGLAVAKLGWKVTRTDVVDVNLRQLARARRKIIHYCYGDDIWEKRWFVTDDDAPGVWSPRVSAKKGTILGEILGQIVEARQFYQNVSCGNPRIKSLSSARQTRL
jgi:hypothetical protein